MMGKRSLTGIVLAAGALVGGGTLSAQEPPLEESVQEEVPADGTAQGRLDQWEDEAVVEEVIEGLKVFVVPYYIGRAGRQPEWSGVSGEDVSATITAIVSEKAGTRLSTVADVERWFEERGKVFAFFPNPSGTADDIIVGDFVGRTGRNVHVGGEEFPVTVTITNHVYIPDYDGVIYGAFNSGQRNRSHFDAAQGRMLVILDPIIRFVDYAWGIVRGEQPGFSPNGRSPCWDVYFALVRNEYERYAHLRESLFKERVLLDCIDEVVFDTVARAYARNNLICADKLQEIAAAEMLTIAAGYLHTPRWAVGEMVPEFGFTIPPTPTHGPVVAGAMMAEVQRLQQEGKYPHLTIQTDPQQQAVELSKLNPADYQIICGNVMQKWPRKQAVSAGEER